MTLFLILNGRPMYSRYIEFPDNDPGKSLRENYDMRENYTESVRLQMVIDYVMVILNADSWHFELRVMSKFPEYVQEFPVWEPVKLDRSLLRLAIHERPDYNTD